MTPSASLLLLSEQSSLLLFSYDMAARQFICLNPACETFFGLAGNKIEESKLLELVHPEDRLYLKSKADDLLAGNTIAEVECRIVRGELQRWLRINPYLSESKGKTYIVGYAEDITTYKQANKNLNEHNHKKNSILNILSHDLAGPLGTISNLSVLLKRETDALNNSKINEYLKLVSKISKNCIHLIRDFLNQEFLESQGIKLLKRRVDLVGKFSTITQEYLDMQENLNLNFFCRANKDAIYAEVDEDKFLQVINNLISNSMKFTPDGGSITINIEEGTDSIMITVADTGVGIPPKYHTTLFDKFSEARRNGLRGEHSTGLGMSIIKTIVEWHKGKVWFQSEENKGTTFYIQLPK